MSVAEKIDKVKKALTEFETEYDLAYGELQSIDEEHSLEDLGDNKAILVLAIDDLIMELEAKNIIKKKEPTNATQT